MKSQRKSFLPEDRLSPEKEREVQNRRIDFWLACAGWAWLAILVSSITLGCVAGFAFRWYTVATVCAFVALGMGAIAVLVLFGVVVFAFDGG